MIARAKLKPWELMPDWVSHCPEFLKDCKQGAETMGTYPDGSFDIDISKIEVSRCRCSLCGFILPALRGYKIVGGQHDGHIVEISMIDIAEGEINEQNSSSSTRSNVE
jgi:hypothetical protein